MSIYTFKSEDAERFVQGLGIKFRTRGSQLELMYCPYCKSTSDKWSFGINTNTGQFECKRASCGVKGNMITLSRDFDFSLGKDTDAYYQTVDYSSKQFKRFKDAHRIFESKGRAIEYLQNRGISEEVTKKYEITTLPDREGIIAFPFKNEDGELNFIKYRNTEFVKGTTKGSKEWCESNCKPILFGMNHCDTAEDDGRLIVTEGQIDSLSVVMAGYTNAVSVPTGCKGFTWIPYCYNFVNQFKQIIVMGDCENGKITLSEEISKRWKNKVKICRVEDYKDCKDANELLQKYGATAIRQAIAEAKPLYDAHIKPLAKVAQVDIMKIPAISTGMSELDESLSGGFHLGQLAVLTGKRGEGKSTIASMWGCHALNQGYNCFFYSGELMDFYFRNWMDCQITGKKEHTQSDHDKLNVWYGNKAFIYDETLAEDGDELQSLLETIEKAIIQNDCKFILLDNLMTAIDVDLSVDIYRSQSKFVGDLARLAKKYEVFILLIAHPRKSNNANLENDDIAGSSNITDKADIVLTYSKPNPSDDPDPDHRRLGITKNRLTGKLREKEKLIWLVYDPKSRRVALNTCDFRNMDFKWNTDPYEQVSQDSMEIIPF